MGGCVCGDIHCSDCGPAQGHSICENCGWCGCNEEEHVTKDECWKIINAYYEGLAREYRESQELARESKKGRREHSWLYKLVTGKKT